jgi:hypothetical protein
MSFKWFRGAPIELTSIDAINKERPYAEIVVPNHVNHSLGIKYLQAEFNECINILINRIVV